MHVIRASAETATNWVDVCFLEVGGDGGGGAFMVYMAGRSGNEYFADTLEARTLTNKMNCGVK